MPNSIITRVRATPVSVPARPDSLHSPGVAAESPEFMAQFVGGADYYDLFRQVKYIFEVETADGQIGIGETYRTVEQTDVEQALNALLGLDVLRTDWRRLPIGHCRVYDAGEAAVLDLAGKLLGVPVHQLLGGAVRDRIECSGWAGRRTPEDAARKAHEAMQRGHRVFKFKCSDNDPVHEWSTAIRERCGDGIKLILDPNQRWRDVANTRRMMEGVPPEMMLALEDPIERQDYAGFRELRETLGVPIFVHVALPYLHQGQRAADLLTALRERCADGFNFNGPMFGFLQLANTAALDGLPCWHGSEVDCGILEAAAVHACAATHNCTVPSDIFGELVREDDLLVEGLQFENGHVLVPQGPGLGIELDRTAMENFRQGDVLEISR